MQEQHSAEPRHQLYPRHASAMNNLGTLTRHPEEAERYYRKALEINPQHNRALFNLGNLLKLWAATGRTSMKRVCVRPSQGKEEEAEQLLKDSILFGPHFADAYSSLASLFAEQVKPHPPPAQHHIYSGVAADTVLGFGPNAHKFYIQPRHR
ncbi:hypothetical protein JZ751_016076 [Albula glossodonta]|uniref:Uncharacterized protein n=1 Tax=Albula glossodonta TaxID=121402 RepID=A0A8T2NQZ1_9TELE|nr:hypothetical protein JZ751_016076 [Albula glossodonta]